MASVIRRFTQEELNQIAIGWQLCSPGKYFVWAEQEPGQGRNIIIFTQDKEIDQEPYSLASFLVSRALVYLSIGIMVQHQRQLIPQFALQRFIDLVSHKDAEQI